MAKSTMSQSSVTSDNSDNDNSESEMDSRSADDEASQSVCVLSKKSRVSTPVSILIESLVKNICAMYETDGQKSEKMYKLICKKLFNMKMIDESYMMNEFEGMRSQFQRAFIHLLTANLGSKALAFKPAWSKQGITNSHYLREFDEIDYIAGGGFGQVFLVRHKLDGTQYAIKKIPIRSEGIKSVRTYLSEVKTFASLNHSNIVQYKAAWLEINESTHKHITNGKIDKSTKNVSSATAKHIDDEYVFSKQESQNFSEKHSDDSDFEIDFEHSINSIRNCSISRTQGKLRKNSRSKSASDLNALCKLNYNDLEELRVQKPVKVKWATLYIQMSLCQSTLKQWLEKRNEIELTQMKKALVPVSAASVRNKTNLEILTQLLKGIEYIHSKGIVHHDVKPSNIFIQPENGNILVQLGDFGLACPLQSVRHSLAFGTKLYAAPEQLAGKCESKSDLYSLGIVLFELVQNFNTDMERVQNVTELRKGLLPDDLPAREPEFSDIIQELTSKKLEDRPDPTALLKRIIKSTECQQIEQLKQTIVEKDEEILHLKELLKSHGIKAI